MYKDLLTIFGYTIQTHSVVSLIAIILAYGVAKVMVKGTVYDKHMSNFTFYAVIGALIGARFWHVFIFQWPYYSQNPEQILMFWHGGVSILGGIVGGATVMIFYTYKQKLSFFELADYLAPALILGQGIGRIACLFAGDVFGAPTGGNFGIVFPEGTNAYSYHGSQPLWLAVLWESQGDFVIFAILFILRGKKLPTGWVFLSYVVLYFTQRFVLEFFRGDSPNYLFNLTAGQWTSIWVILTTIILGVIIFIRQNRYGVKRVKS